MAKRLRFDIEENTTKNEKNPDKLDIILGIFDSTHTSPRILTFYGKWVQEENEKSTPVTDNKLPTRIHLHMDRVQRENGSGVAWLIGGYCNDFKDRSTPMEMDGFYSTTRNKGYFYMKG